MTQGITRWNGVCFVVVVEIAGRMERSGRTLRQNLGRRTWRRSWNNLYCEFALTFMCLKKTYFPICIAFSCLLAPGLTLSLLMSYIHGAPSKARYLTSYKYGRDFLLGILLLEPCISLIHEWKTNKYTNYSFRLLIMYGSSYMFRHYIVIIRDRS
jgi:hypothetical protein